VPQIIQANVKRPIINLFLTEKRMIAFNMEQDVSILGLDAYLQHSFLVKSDLNMENSLPKTPNT
jgi:hypothetical protein